MKKTLSMVLALMLTCGAAGGMVACGGRKPSPNTESDLEIFYRYAGEGIEWLDKIVAAFEAKNPEVNVVKNYVESNAVSVESQLVNPEINTVDLYVTSLPMLLAYTDYLEPLNDVLDVDVDGKGITIKEKHNKNLLAFNTKDEQIYAGMCGGGACGLVYNKTAFEKLGYEIPRTTDELAALAADMVDDKQIPFIFCGNADYWTYCYITWAAQYGGIEEVNNFWNARYVDPETGEVEQPSLKAMTSEGRKQALIAFEECVAPRGYAYDASNSTDHTTAQTLFLSGKALMMPNGCWLENEMKNTKSDIEYLFMRTPVISALGDKLDISDKVLAEVVSYVDSADYATNTINDDSKEYDAYRVKSVSKEIIDRVAEARKIVYTESASGKLFIPNYANAKEWAKKFIQFMCSDEGLYYYYDTLQINTSVSPTVEIDTSDWSPFMKSAAELWEGADLVCRAKGYQLFYNNGLEFFPSSPQTFIAAANLEDKLTATQYWNEKCVSYYTNNWDRLLQTAGLK